MDQQPSSPQDRTPKTEGHAFKVSHEPAEAAAVEAHVAKVGHQPAEAADVEAHVANARVRAEETVGDDGSVRRAEDYPDVEGHAFRGG